MSDWSPGVALRLGSGRLPSFALADRPPPEANRRAPSARPEGRPAHAQVGRPLRRDRPGADRSLVVRVLDPGSPTGLGRAWRWKPRTCPSGSGSLGGDDPQPAVAVGPGSPEDDVLGARLAGVADLDLPAVGHRDHLGRGHRAG